MLPAGVDTVNSLSFLTGGSHLSVQSYTVRFSYADATPDADARRDLALECRDAIEEYGVSRGWARKRDKTLFYFYGESFADMRKRLARRLADNPRFSTATIKRMA